MHLGKKFLAAIFSAIVYSVPVFALFIELDDGIPLQVIISPSRSETTTIFISPKSCRVCFHHHALRVHKQSSFVRVAQCFIDKQTNKVLLLRYEQSLLFIRRFGLCNARVHLFWLLGCSRGAFHSKKSRTPLAKILLFARKKNPSKIRKNPFVLKKSRTLFRRSEMPLGCSDRAMEVIVLIATDAI